MVSSYKAVYEGGTGEIIEKKSRFITTVIPAEDEDTAITFIESLRKKYWNASHNCYAYVIGERNELQRCSDDGEPQGTAGRPMLEVLLGEGVHNCCVVVTRYFGGTLLGTGGLVRAYQAATKAGLEGSVIITKKHGIDLSITTDYTGLGKIQYILGQRGIKIVDSVYTDKVELEVLVPVEELQAVKTAITEGTNGQAIMEEVLECYYADINGEPTILD